MELKPLDSGDLACCLVLGINSERDPHDVLFLAVDFDKIDLVVAAFSQERDIALISTDV